MMWIAAVAAQPSRGGEMDRPGRAAAGLAVALMLALVAAPALAQAPGGPPAVGVVTVEPATITESSEFVGRVQAVQRVALTARVTAFLEQRQFVVDSGVAQALAHFLGFAPHSGVLFVRGIGVPTAG